MMNIRRMNKVCVYLYLEVSGNQGLKMKEY